MRGISEKRIERELEELGGFGRDGSGGITRLSYSPSYVEAALWLIGRFRELGLKVFCDKIGNIFGVLPGEGDSTFLSGSHLDTVKSGGGFDGGAGIIVALEAVRIVKEQGITPHSNTVVAAFVEEEGASFQAALVGSAYLSGRLADEKMASLIDDDGRAIGVIAREFCDRISPYLDGFYPLGLPSRAVEVHIEQGARLDRSGRDFCVPPAIVGTSMTEVEMTGEMNHAGTTPMDIRRDPFRGTVEVASRLNGHVKKFPGAVGTIGRVILDPNVANVVPGKVTFSLDIRGPVGEDLKKLIDLVITDCHGVAEEMDLGLKVKGGHSEPPTDLDPILRNRIFEAMDKRGWSWEEFPSGAGHDAINLASICPTAMIFVPSKGGRSHCPEEWTEAASLAKAAQVLADLIVDEKGVK